MVKPGCLFFLAHPIYNRCVNILSSTKMSCLVIATSGILNQSLGTSFMNDYEAE